MVNRQDKIYEDNYFKKIRSEKQSKSRTHRTTETKRSKTIIHFNNRAWAKEIINHPNEVTISSVHLMYMVSKRKQLHANKFNTQTFGGVSFREKNVSIPWACPSNHPFALSSLVFMYYWPSMSNATSVQRQINVFPFCKTYTSHRTS